MMLEIARTFVQGANFVLLFPRCGLGIPQRLA